eukprot:scaffold24048_cov194-Amphora_coffeaeformis.AAC.8
MLPYSSGPSWGNEMAGMRGSDAVEKAKNPSQCEAQVSRMARMVVAWADSMVYSRHMILGPVVVGDCCCAIMGT